MSDETNDQANAEVSFPPLSAVVVARDEAAMIDGCLRRLHFADEIVVVVDSRTNDDTAQSAAAAGAIIHIIDFEDFAQFKQAAVDLTSNEWVLVVDADERITERLACEIRGVLATTSYTAFKVPIENWFFGGKITHGGWNEQPVRLFHRSSGSYEGLIHERFVLGDGGEVGVLEQAVIHFSHRSIADNLAKTSAYAEIQARSMYESGHPPVTWRTLIGVMVRDFVKRTVFGRGYLDGMPGFLECIYQPFSTFCVYTRLWEMQRTPSLEERYEELDRVLK